MDARIDLKEITGPMILHRDKLLQEADADIAYAAQARAEAKEAANRALQEGEEVAERYERSAATRRAYAEHWNGVIAREEQAFPKDATVVDPQPEAAQVPEGEGS